MLAVKGYHNFTTIHQGPETLIISAVRTQDDKKVVLKQLRPDIASADFIIRYRKEFNILQSLSSDLIIKPYAYIERNNTPIIVLEAATGKPLSALIEQKTLPLKQTLALIYDLTQALEYIHSQQLIHKNLSFSNVLYDVDSSQLKLVDFSLANHQQPVNWSEPNSMLEGTLNYMSPEQTGRMSRSVDYRSDFYALGAIFFQLLTGQPPFKADDSLQLIYQHLTRQAPSPQQFNTAIPAAVSKIALKLLSKMPEDRYQSTYSIKQDLNHCLQKLTLAGTAPASIDFEIALDDISEQLNLSEKLLDREMHLQALRTALNKAKAGGIETIICTGIAGSGKTSLLQEYQKEVINAGSYLGRSQISVAEPNAYTRRLYNAFSTALADLSRQLLAADELPAIRQALSDSLGNNYGVFCDFCPEFKAIIDPPSIDPPNIDPPNIDTLKSDPYNIDLYNNDPHSNDPHKIDPHSRTRKNPADTKKILIKSIYDVIKTLTINGKVVVLFIDNIQWIDNPSIKLFRSMLRHYPLSHFVLICGLRTDPLNNNKATHWLKNISRQQVPTVKILEVNKLSIHSVQLLVSEALFRPLDEVSTLCQLIHSKTNGNAMAVRIFITRLHNKKIIYFNRRHREWNWDINLAESETASTNVTQLLAKKITHLDAITTRVLKIGACIGEYFHLKSIKNVSGLSFSDTFSGLLQAVEADYLVSSIDTANNQQKIIYRFATTEIHQAAYSLLNSAELTKVHNDIGLNFIQQHLNDPGEQIFEIINHLNNNYEASGQASIDQRKLAELNIIAGHKAKKDNRWPMAFKLLKIAIDLSPRDNFKKIQPIYIEAAEAAYLCGQTHKMHTLIETCKQYNQDPVAQAQAEEIRLRFFVANNQYDNAIQLGNQLLRILAPAIQLDFGYRDNATKNSSILRINLKLAIQAAKLSRNLASSTRPSAAYKISMKILLTLSMASLWQDSRRATKYNIIMMDMTIKHGLSTESTIAFPLFGSALINHFGTIGPGYHYGTLANKYQKVLDTELPDRQSSAVALLNSLILNWKHPVRETVAALSSAYRTGIETGAIELALLAGTSSACARFFLGHELNSLDVSFDKLHQQATKFQQLPMSNLCLTYQQTIRQLMLTHEQHAETSQARSNNDFEQTLDTPNPGHAAQFHLIQLFLATLYNQPATALAQSKKVRLQKKALNNPQLLVLFMLYETLACISNLDQTNYYAACQLRLRIKLNQRNLRQWAHHAPENVLHACHLIEATLAQRRGDFHQALDHFELAIHLAEKNDFQNEHALACEMICRLLVTSNKYQMGSFYLQKTRAAYVRWGAMAKVRILDDEFIELKQTSGYDAQLHQTQLPVQHQSGTYKQSENYLDLSSVIKASQALAGEIILVNLLEKLMQLSLENAGAHAASLLLRQGDQLHLEIASCSTGTTTEHKLQRVALKSTTNLPLSIIQYVARAQQDLVLNDALNEDIFTQDEYILQARPKSILCIPIMSQAHLTGILYLENLHISHAFTQDRIAILKLLASQAAISLENSKLYQQLNDSKNKYLSLYQNAVEGMLEINMRGQLISINPAATALLGYKAPSTGTALERLKLSNLFIDRLALKYFLKTLFSQRRVIGFETRLQRLDHTHLWVALSAHITPDDDSRPQLVEASIIDITERKRRQDAEQAKHLAEAATATKSQFLATMSHEIRTPMNAIIGFTDLALQTPLSDNQQAYLSTIKKASNHLLRVVNDILDISKFESGKLKLSITEFRLKDILDEIDNLFSLEARKKGLQLVVLKTDNIVSVPLMGDAFRISQVIINLVNNAIKFTTQGQIHISISHNILPMDSAISSEGGRSTNTFSTAIAADSIDIEKTMPESLASNAHSDIRPASIQLNFSIKDTGIGIDAAHLETIFDSFTQSEPEDNQSGTGLGLAICRHLVELMHGTIEVVSNKGNGSCFNFSIIVPRAVNAELATSKPNTLIKQNVLPEATAITYPVQAKQNMHDTYLANTGLSNTGVSSTNVYITGGDSGACQNKPTSPREILLVEDNSINQQLALEMLTRAGYIVTIANHGQQALQCLDNKHQQKESFYAVLMDLRMPVMNGMEAMKIIRSKAYLQHLPIIALSAGVLPEEIEAALALGFNSYVTKPVDFSSLLNQLDNLAEKITSFKVDTVSNTAEPDINLHLALANFDNDENLLRQLVAEFIRLYASSCQTLSSHLTNNETEAAERLMHNVAGVAGSFGANQLMAAARHIEQSLIQHQPCTPASLGEFSACLNIFVASIQVYLQQTNDTGVKNLH
ncbi:MAG: protein kinase [Pseudomonadales bacterium]|nr:protein kinase [Pseudomonadales bacterium]